MILVLVLGLVWLKIHFAYNHLTCEFRELVFEFTVVDVQAFAFSQFAQRLGFALNYTLVAIELNEIAFKLFHAHTHTHTHTNHK